MCHLHCKKGSLAVFHRTLRCTKAHEVHFCMNQRYNTRLQKKATSHYNVQKCVHWLGSNCRTEPGEHCQMHCNAKNWDEFRDLRCGNDASRRFCQQHKYRDTSSSAQIKQKAHGEKSCMSRLQYFCALQKHDPQACGVCAGRLWHELESKGCGMGVIKKFCG